MTRVTLRSMHRPTERGHADGSGFGVTGGGLLPVDAGAIGGRLATKTAATTTIETAIAMRIVDRRREIIRPVMGGGFHQPPGRAAEEELPKPLPDDQTRARPSRDHRLRNPGRLSRHVMSSEPSGSVPRHPVVVS